MANTISIKKLHIDIEELSSGNELVFRQLFNHFFPILYRKIYSRVLDDRLTDDILQEVFIATWNSRQKLHVVQDLDAYIFGITKNQLHSYFRKSRNSIIERDVDIERLDYHDNNTPETDLRTKEILVRIDQIITLMPDTMQHCYQLFYKESLSIRDISSRLNLSEQTVKNNLSMAKLRIKQLIPDVPSIMLILYPFFD